MQNFLIVAHALLYISHVKINGTIVWEARATLFDFDLQSISKFSLFLLAHD
jgi:hypothetical protein